MRSICSIALVISISLSFAGEKGPDAIIWYDGSTFYKSLNKKKQATIYFSKWEPSIQQFSEDRNYRVAIQLDQQMDPNPNDGVALPNIKYLSAIADDSVIADYFRFLENHGRTVGFQHLVLPDTTGLSIFEKEVIEHANRISPFFFLRNNSISGNLPESKKELRTNNPVVWVSKQSYNSKRLNKWSKAVGANFEESFYKGIDAETEYVPARKLSESLTRRIFMKGIIAIDKEERLPLKSKAVIYRGKDEKLRRRLSDYVTVRDRLQIEEFPIILDRREGFEGKLFGNEIIIDFLETQESIENSAILVPGRFEHDEIVISKMLFGALEISGRAEVEGSKKIPEQGVVGYSTIQFEGLTDEIELVGDIAKLGIEKFATPGCQLSVVKNGSVVFEKSYGHFTYDSLKAVENSTLYDLASVTKVIATLPAIALLVDQGKIQLDDPIGKHLPNFAGSNKSHVTIKQLLAHNGGIRSYIPFWKRAMNGDRLNSFFYKTKEDETNDVRSYGIEYHPSMRDSLKSWLRNSDLTNNPQKYLYSDLGYMILHMLVEEVAELPFDQFLAENFYKPMSLNIGFNPRGKEISLTSIAPTEFDRLFREDQVWGEVHDRNAHIFGGVAGHAGLFSNATDLAKMMYMLSNGGYYAGKQYLKKETLDLFNARYFTKNRRGLGWDKKDWKRDGASYQASDSSFGHTGFTGTMVWSDPEKDLIYVFLSNRIYPDSKNDKLMEMNIRTEIHDVIYESIINE
ncbi:MAG: serine hydrolase [Cyclobacteriaceae bacterium]